MEYVVIGMEIICVFVLLVVLYGCLFENRKCKRKDRLFVATTFFSMLGTFVDAIGKLLNGNIEYVKAARVTLLFCFIFGYLITALYVHYLLEVIEEKHHVPKFFPMIVGGTLLSVIIFTIVGAVTGNLYSYVDGYYTVGSWYPFSQVYYYLVAVYGITFLIYYRKYVSRHDMIAFFSYYVLPLVSLVCHFICPELNFSFVAVSMSMLILYVAIQGEINAEHLGREKRLKEQSYTDFLTGLQNRRAYDRACDQMQGNHNVGVIFCDLNALKYVNDHHGHMAGDDLIMAFTERLRQHFDKENIYRISGDEFMVMIPNISAREYERKVDEFRDSLDADERLMASVGCEYGIGDHILDLVRVAEKKMYGEKDKFYQIFPEYKRGR
ncbi:MAG: GGDEF domain-containing protein [Lachnospiraceae bacterium]|nr:GGDEF domain-containing protein [Lachnospiraceae bacterium]